MDYPGNGVVVKGVIVSLTKPDVVRAGVEILDAYGLGDLSMRRLAERLGVKAGALYWHVANKQSLLAAVSDEILAVDGGPTTVPSQDAELSDGVDEWARCFRATLLAHRDGAELVASTISVGLGKTDPTVKLRQFMECQGSAASVRIRPVGPWCTWCLATRWRSRPVPSCMTSGWWARLIRPDKMTILTWPWPFLSPVLSLCCELATGFHGSPWYIYVAR